MPRARQCNSRAALLSRDVSTIVFVLAFVSCVFFAAQIGFAQTFTVIHNFTGEADGSNPVAGLVFDARGNLYGTADTGGRGNCSPQNGCGVVFKMSHAGSGFIFSTLYSFLGGNDGAGPYGRVVIGSNGSLYGGTVGGGSINCPGGCGTVYNLRPPPTACASVSCPWQETVLYRFQGSPDAFYPTGDLIFDQAGALYGTTYVGGTGGPGTVYKLTPSGGGWSESVIYSLTGGNDGGNPYGGVVFDNNGNLYCSALAGAMNGNGAVFELSPSGSGWTEHTLHDFDRTDGTGPQAGLLFAAGALFGATVNGGTDNAGTVYEFTPSGGGWTFNSIFSFTDTGTGGPFAKLTMDASGNLYGATQGGAPGNFCTVIKLTPSGSGWTETVLYQFTGGTDGSVPMGSVIVDASGKVYGTTFQGGALGKGVVFEITP